MNIGILTGGGDCPGLNPAIRGVVRRSIKDYKYNCFGIKNGWNGLIKGEIEALASGVVEGLKGLLISTFLFFHPIAQEL